MERSFWEQVKTGRYKGEAALMRKAMRGRARRILAERPPRGLTSVIVKQVSSARSVEALRRVARYIARLDVDYERTREGSTGSASKERTRAVEEAQERHPPRVFDEFGAQVDNRAVLDRLREWVLIEDGENLSVAGARAHRNGGWPAVRALGGEGEEAYEEIQGRHIVVSVRMPVGGPRGGDRAQPAERVGMREKVAFEEAAREMVRETFGAWGYPALVAVHVEHGKELHAHILVGTTRTTDDFAEAIDARGRGNRGSERFVFDKNGIVADALRQALADAAEKYGFRDLDTTRREDRGDIVVRALAGEEEIRPAVQRQAYDEQLMPAGIDDLPPIVRRTVRRAPLFVTENADAIARRLEKLERARARGAREIAGRPDRNADRPNLFPPKADRAPAAREAPTGLIALLARRLGSGSDDRPPAVPEAAVVNEVHAIMRTRRVFETPAGEDRSAAGIANWLAMRREDLRYADWALLNAPWLFEEVTQEAIEIAKDREAVPAIQALTAADVEADDAFRRKRLQETSPEALRAIHEKALLRAQEALEAAPGAHGAERIARKAQRVIVRSYLTLADEIEAAFTGDSEEDRRMLVDAGLIRERAWEVQEMSPLPTAGTATVGDREAGRVQPERARDRPDRPTPRGGRDGDRDR